MADLKILLANLASLNELSNADTDFSQEQIDRIASLFSEMTEIALSATKKKGGTREEQREISENCVSSRMRKLRDENRNDEATVIELMFNRLVDMNRAEISDGELETILSASESIWRVMRTVTHRTHNGSSLPCG